jgi:hypothetical protein
LSIVKPNKLTIHELFQRERRYVVPLYQRACVWNREDQWEPLWDDIERQTEACLKAEDFISNRPHFPGAIVLNVSKIVGARVARSEIFDGRQRLTTLQLLIAAIRDYAAQVGLEYVSRLRCLTLNQYEKVGSDDSFKVWPTNAERDTFRSVMSAGSPEALLMSLGNDPSSAPRMVAAYLYVLAKA